MDDYPIDYTGYGPSSAGNAPTPYEMERQLRYQMHTNRNSMAMQHLDPYIAKAAERVVGQLTAGGANTPEEVRRVVYGTAAGQASLDTITAARIAGVVGYGDPMAYAAKIQAGVAGGGFNVHFGGSQGAQPGQVFGGSQYVSGQGIIAERATQSFLRSTLEGVYGKGSANPDNFYGIDMEGAGTIFQHIAKNGGLGNVGTIKRNASLVDRIRSAKNNELDKSIVDDLAKVDLSSDAAAKRSIDALMGDDSVGAKTKNALKSVQANPNAFVFNEENNRRVQDLMKVVGEGVASVVDIYENLSTGEAITKLESVSGMRIRDGATAKAATHQFEKLRNTARSVGMDEQVFMEIYGANARATLNQVMQVNGFDSRTLSLGKQVNAVINQDAMNYGSAAAKFAQQGIVAMNEAGITGIHTPETQAIIEDRQAGNIMAGQRFGGVALAQGSLDYLSEEKRAAAKKLLDKFYASDNIADMTTNARALDGMMIDLYGEDGLKGQTALAAKAQGMNQRLLSKTQEQRQRDINLNASQSKLGDMLGITDEKTQRELASQLAFGLGAQGLGAVMDSTTNNDMTGADRQNAVRENLLRGGITAESGFYERFFDESGRLKDRKGFSAAARAAVNANRGHASRFSEEYMINDRLDQYGANDGRKLRKEGGFLKNLATGFLSGDIKGFNDHTFMMMAEEIGQGGMLEGATTGSMDFRDNSKLMENLAQLDKLKGGELGAYAALGYDSREAMVAEMSKSGVDGLRAKEAFMELLNSDAEFSSLGLSGGGIDSLRVYDRSKMNALREKHGEEFSKRKDDMMSLTLLAPAFSDGFYKNQMDKLKSNGEFDLEGFDAATIYRNNNNDGGSFMMGDGQASFSRIQRMADTIIGMSDKDLAQLDKSGDLQKAFDHHKVQASNLKDAKLNKGVKTVTYQHPDGTTEEMDIDKAIKKNEIAQSKIQAFQNGEQFIPTIRVQNLYVEEKKD